MVRGLNVLKNPSETHGLLTRVFQVFLAVPGGPRAVPVLWQTPLAACRGRRHYYYARFKAVISLPVSQKCGPSRCRVRGRCQLACFQFHPWAVNLTTAVLSKAQLPPCRGQCQCQCQYQCFWKCKPAEQFHRFADGAHAPLEPTCMIVTGVLFV